MNFIEGKLEPNGAGPAFVAGERRLPLDGYPFATAAGRRAAGDAGRPARASGHRRGAAPGTGFTVDIVEPMGADTSSGAATASARSRCAPPATGRRAPGDRMTLAVDPNRISLFATDTGLRL